MSTLTHGSLQWAVGRGQPAPGPPMVTSTLPGERHHQKSAVFCACGTILEQFTSGCKKTRNMEFLQERLPRLQEPTYHSHISNIVTLDYHTIKLNSIIYIKYGF